MKILIIPDKFKGSLSSTQVCDVIEKGIKTILPESKITKLPLADGGEESLEALETQLKFERVYLKVHDSLNRPIETFYGVQNNIAYIELAKATGLQLLRETERNPNFTSSFGTGEMILHALNNGAKKIYLFVGGSSTNDFGIGIAAALGYSFYDAQGKLLEPIGKNLINVKKIDNSNAVSLKNIDFHVLTDVKNMLFGKNGAAYTFAEQKGADNEEITELDKGLINISNVIKSEFNVDVSKLEGGGAAGGVGAGAVVFCNAKINSGIDTILDLLNVDEKIIQSDLVITGEGKLDSQTLEGKVVNGVMHRCRKLKTSFSIVCGENTLTESELVNFFPAIIKPIKKKGITKEDAINNAGYYLEKRAEEVINDYLKYFV